MSSRKTSFTAIGTKWSITVHDSVTTDKWQKLLTTIQKRIDIFDKTYSRFMPDSLVSRMSKKAGIYPLPIDANKLLKFYEQLYLATSGQVTPLIGQALSDAGYDAKYSFASKPLTKPPTWEDTIKYDHKKLELSRPALLDFGAAGKGYLVDILSAIIAKAGIHDYVIDASGDILHRSSFNKPISIGLENPMNLKQVIGIARLSNASLCASSGARRVWGKYTHILDPTTLLSPQNIIATWVVAKDAMTADGLSTALFFTSPKKLDKFNFSYAILHNDMQLEYSKSFPAEIFGATSA
ncbi:MAG TPA: FAD:protein FMN transferase [Patescibacteria group bacterium]|nr:FAD:protein FMN transferase [Patescibacteria group bacterium]